MRNALVLAALLACGGGDDSAGRDAHTIVTCTDDMGRQYRCELACKEPTLSTTRTTCSASHPSASGNPTCPYVIDYDGLEGCCFVQPVGSAEVSFWECD